MLAFLLFLGRHTCIWAQSVQSRLAIKTLCICHGLYCCRLAVLCCMLPCTQESSQCFAKVCEGSSARASLEQASRLLSCNFTCCKRCLCAALSVCVGWCEGFSFASPKPCRSLRKNFLFTWGHQHCRNDLETDRVDHSALCAVSCMRQCSHRLLCRLLAAADTCCAALYR